jgi:hypothetical protein
MDECKGKNLIFSDDDIAGIADAENDNLVGIKAFENGASLFENGIRVYFEF